MPHGRWRDRDIDNNNDVDYNGDHAGEEVHIDNEDTEGDETGTGQHLPPVGAH